MAANKERIDLLLVEQGFFESREKAKTSVMAGLVFVDGERMEKAGTMVPRGAAIAVKGAPHPYVSRGGLKLEKALEHFRIDLSGKTVLDVGASTGGFTDCALRHGANYVYAVDVGYNQLDWTLRSHPQVKVMERTNFRYADAKDFNDPRPDFAVIDVSFISLKLILPPLKTILEPVGAMEIAALIKPQFEAGRDKVGKSGVVRDPAVHEEVLRHILAFAHDIGFVLKGLTYSPITGGEGNIEFLAHWSAAIPSDPAGEDPYAMDSIVDTVREASQQFKHSHSR